MAGKENETLEREHVAIINEARAQIAAGREPNAAGLEARLRAATDHARADADPERASAIDEAGAAAAKQLDRVIGVHRARQRIARDPVPAPAATPRPSLRSALRTRPTITGNIDVRRTENEEALLLAWEPTAGVADWEVRFSERPSPGGDYVVLETVTLPAETTSVEVPLGEKAFRVNIVGRSRDGRPRSRAIISGLTKSSWKERWERRATAS
jgi:hypothetical protein